MTYGDFRGYSEVTNLTATKYSTKGKLRLSKSVVFEGVMSKIEFEQNWRYGYVLNYGFGSN